MKESDILHSRTEKLRREARSVRTEVTRLSNPRDRQRLLDAANSLESHARELEGPHARRRAHRDQRGTGVQEPAWRA